MDESSGAWRLREGFDLIHSFNRPHPSTVVADKHGRLHARGHTRIAPRGAGRMEACGYAICEETSSMSFWGVTLSVGDYR